MSKPRIIGAIVLMVAVAAIGVLLFMKMEATQVQNQAPVEVSQ
jgi:hypothetical protein